MGGWAEHSGHEDGYVRHAGPPTELRQLFRAAECLFIYHLTRLPTV